MTELQTETEKQINLTDSNAPVAEGDAKTSVVVSVLKTYALPMVALGCWFAWFWLACGQGFGLMATSAVARSIQVVCAFGAAAAVLLCFLHERLAAVLSHSGAISVAALLCGIASLLIALDNALMLPVALVYVASAVAGGCAPVLILACLQLFKGTSPKELFGCLMAAWLPAAILFYLVVGVPTALAAILFALLPVATAVLCLRGRAVVPVAEGNPASWAQKPQPLLPRNDLPGKYRELLLCAVLFFFTIGFVRSTGLAQVDGVQNFSLGASTLVIFSVISALFALVYWFRSKLSVYFIRGCYTFACLGISFATMSMALGNTGTLAVRSVTDLAYFLFFLVIIVLAWAAVDVHGMKFEKVFAQFGLTLVGASLAGWLMQQLLQAVYPAPNTTTTMLLTLGFLCFAYFMFGFKTTECSLFMSRVDDMKAALSVEGAVGAQDGSYTELRHEPRQMSFRQASEVVAEQAQLSQREIDVFHLLAKGWSNDYIAEELTISYHTVRAHVRSIYAKLDVHNRQEMLELINTTRGVTEPEEESLGK